MIANRDRSEELNGRRNGAVNELLLQIFESNPLRNKRLIDLDARR